MALLVDDFIFLQWNIIWWIEHCNIPKLVSYTKWWYGIFQYHTTIWIVVWYWKIPYHHSPSDFEKTNFWYITMRIPWLCLGGICKYWPHSSKLGSNVNLPPAAVGLHWAPISQNIGQYLPIPPRQSQGIVPLSHITSGPPILSSPYPSAHFA